MYEIKYRDKEEFKNIDIDDYTEIPKDWDIIRTGILFRLGRGRVISKEEILDNKGEYPVYSSQTANNGILGYINTYDFKGEYITWTTDGANAGTVFKRTGKFNCTNVCGTLKPEKNLDLGYIAYILSTVTKKNVRIDINPKLMNTEMSSIKILFPKIYEQEKISNFLDYKTSQFDSIIEKKEKLIEKLEEAKKSLISEVITGKVKIVDGKLVKRDESEMKDSGVEWLGKIPKDWEVKKLKHIIKEPLMYGANESGENNNIELPRYIRITDFDLDGNLREDTFKSLEYKKAAGFFLKEGDILFARSGATVGKTFIFKDYKGKACFAGYLIKAVLDRSKCIPEFFYYFTKSFSYENWKKSIVIQATIENISAEKYREIQIGKPTIKEQLAINNYIEKLINNYSLIIDRNKTQIEKIKQAKQSLISEAVTGKIDLRDWEVKGDLNE